MPLLGKGQVSIWSCRQYVSLRWTGGFSGVGYPIAAPPPPQFLQVWGYAVSGDVRASSPVSI